MEEEASLLDSGGWPWFFFGRGKEQWLAAEGGERSVDPCCCRRSVAEDEEDGAGCWSKEREMGLF